MNSKFLITLKQVRFNIEAFPDAPQKLEHHYNKLYRKIGEHQISHSQTLKQYVRNEYAKITEVQTHLAAFYTHLNKTELSKLNEFEITKHQNELDYFHSILTITDDARGLLLEYLSIYFPELFDTEQKIKIVNDLLPFKPNTVTPQPIEKTELKIDQIALKYVYEGLQITRINHNEIAKQYGHNSGEKLFQRFTYYSSTANRKGKPTPFTQKKLDNKIKLIESIIELLPTDKQGRAKDEVLILKKIYDTEYQ